MSARIRITGGSARSRFLVSPKGLDVRPTASRVREAIFNVVGPRVAGARVLDLYAGVGTLGLEALSRGAERVVFVERAAACAALIRANLERLDLAARGRVVCGDTMRFLERPGPDAPFDLAFVDPPYRTGALPRLLPLIFGADIISGTGLVVVEHGTDEGLPEGSGWTVGRTYTYGKTAVTLVQAP